MTIQNSNLQFTHLVVTPPPAAGGKLLTLIGGELSLLNTNIRPEQILVQANPTAPAQPSIVSAWQFLVIGAAKGPPGAIIEVRTVEPPPPPNAADLSVRFSPAVNIEGRTPRPDRGNAIVVKSWTLDASGAVKPAPGYEVKLLGPAAEGAQRPVLKAMPFRPAPETFRAKLDDDAPTLEVMP